MLKTIFQQFPLIKQILTFFFDFIDLSENYDLLGLDTWLKNVTALQNSYLNKACAAVQRDYTTIQNSIIFREYSNGPIEGKNTKTKFIKRGMFGRSSFNIIKRKMLLLGKF